jgi:hypothetical protein
MTFWFIFFFLLDEKNGSIIFLAIAFPAPNANPFAAVDIIVFMIPGRFSGITLFEGGGDDVRFEYLFVLDDFKGDILYK